MVGTVTWRARPTRRSRTSTTAGHHADSPSRGRGAVWDDLTAIAHGERRRARHEIVSYALERLKTIEGLRLIGKQTPTRHGPRSPSMQWRVRRDPPARSRPVPDGRASRARRPALRAAVCVRDGIFGANTRASFSVVHDEGGESKRSSEGLGLRQALFGA